MTQASDRVRLHITPFNPDLYDRVVSTSAKATATGVSYHSVQTQPEKGFGYIELPRMEADKLKKKIHGFTLKGSKVRVEEAKPEKKRKADRDETEEERSERKKAKKQKKEKKAKREEGVLEGYELEDGRHVQRGWSEGKDKKKKSKDQKMLFKTNVPPNAMPLEDEKKAKSKEKKAKKQADKDGEKRSHKTPKVVEEFAKKKPVIISAESNSKAAAEYVEGKGWVDEDGVIVEAEPPSVKRQRAKERALKLAEETRLAEEERQQAEAMDVDTQKEEGNVAGAESDREDVSSDDVSDGASSISEDDESEDDDNDKEEAKKASPATGARNHAQTDGEVVAPALADDLATPVPESARQVHPLEALYKRAPDTAAEDGSKHNLPPINTSFSFFNPEDIEDDDEDMASVPTHPPQTPHTKQDLEWRALRSAAPTPDTAGLGKRFRFAMEGAAQDEDEDSDEDADADMADDVADATTSRDIANVDGKEESEFRKWFYEHRGENNRAWKKKRKEAKKQQRQRENRRLTRRVV